MNNSELNKASYSQIRHNQSFSQHQSSCMWKVNVVEIFYLFIKNKYLILSIYLFFCVEVLVSVLTTLLVFSFLCDKVSSIKLTWFNQFDTSTEEEPDKTFLRKFVTFSEPCGWALGGADWLMSTSTATVVCLGNLNLVNFSPMLAWRNHGKEIFLRDPALSLSGVFELNLPAPVVAITCSIKSLFYKIF